MTATSKKPICTIDADGTESWTLNGYMHREDGPAFIRPDVGYTQWNKNGAIHRLDGPAVMYPGGERWYKHGKLHRLGGPAVTKPDGTKIWYVKDLMHRTDGPALMRGDGSVEWYLHGKRITAASRFQHRTHFSDEYIAMLVLTFGKIQ